MNLVQELERKFLPLCESARDAIATRYPNYQFNVWSSSVGGATQFQGHNLGIEAVFPNAPTEKANTVAIVIGLKHLTTTPVIDEAGICWGVGISGDDFDLLDEPIPCSEANLDHIESNFPTLLETFEQAVSSYSRTSSA